MNQSSPHRVSGAVPLTDGGHQQEAGGIECMLMRLQSNRQRQIPKTMEVMDGGEEMRVGYLQDSKCERGEPYPNISRSDMDEKPEKVNIQVVVLNTLLKKLAEVIHAIRRVNFMGGESTLHLNFLILTGLV